MAFQPQDQVFWQLLQPKPKQLRETIHTDVVVIGGGMAGLTAAQAFTERGLSVVLVEQYYCGSGATGKSSGFITPDSELELSHFVDLFGTDQAKRIWEFAISGINHIRDTIKKHTISCDYQEQDSIIVANSNHAFKQIASEAQARAKCNYSSQLYSQDTLTEVVGSTGYYGGVRYGNTFGINAYRYCIALRNLLIDLGVQVFEETPVTQIEDHRVHTSHGIIHAQHIIVATDRFIPQLGVLKDAIYQAQTFLMMSAPLSDYDVRAMFPQTNLMVWDTNLIYNYYRLTGENRLMLGGATLATTYTNTAKYHNEAIVRKKQTYFKQKFPQIDVRFEYLWPGLIGVSKDLMPISGPDRERPSIYYIGACAGLPWAAACGLYSAQYILDHQTDFDVYFSPYRSFPVGKVVQAIIGKRLSFALSHGITLFL